MKILLVEDNQSDATLFIEALAAIAPTSKLHVAVNIPQAMDYVWKRGQFVEAETPDICIIDLNLPIYKGDSLLQMIKSDSRTAGIRCVVFTSSDRFNDRRMCEELGADGYRVKPIHWTEYRETIRQILSCPPA